MCFAHFCLQQPSSKSFLICLGFFLTTQHPPLASLTFSSCVLPWYSCFLVDSVGFVGFSLIWLPKGAHQHLWELFLHPTSIRSTSTSLKKPNLHPFHLLLKPIILMLVLHIPYRLVHRFSIPEPLTISLVIRILFSSLTIASPLPMITLANGSQIIAKGIGLACPLPSLLLTFVLHIPNEFDNLL